jgi:hypothetical protein
MWIPGDLYNSSCNGSREGERMSTKPQPIVLGLSDEERETLNVLVRSRTAAVRHVERAAIILGLAAGGRQLRWPTSWGLIANAWFGA